jgi:hypothetical protein
MSKLPDLVAKTNSLAQALLVALPPSPVPLDNPAGKAIRAAYAAAQKFDYDSSFSLDQTTDAYVDLADLATQLLRQEYFINNSNVTEAAKQVRDAIVGSTGAPGVVVGNPNAVSGTYYATPTKPAWNFAGAHGLSIYLPLGERDCRQTGLQLLLHAGAERALAPCEAPENVEVKYQIEPQLSYYKQPDQLRFSSAEGAQAWATLLERLDPTTPNWDPDLYPDRPPIQSPFPAASRWLVYLPLVRR